MGYKARSLFSIINSINNKDLFLPHIQRPFVWDNDQMSKLFDSLMRGYPVQTFLFWKTKNEIKARKFMEIISDLDDLHDLYEPLKSEEGIEKTFVLDGQQRLQTLYCIYYGKIYDTKTHNNLEAYIDITSSEVNADTEQIFNLEFLAETPSNIALFRIKDVLTKYAKQNSEEISDLVNDLLETELGENKIRARNVRRNISRIRSILKEENDFWVEELDGIANPYPYETVVEIFVRVNSGGTKLDASDLMFAAMKELSATIEENLEDIATQLSDNGLSFSIDTILKGILLVNGKSPNLTHKVFSGQEGKILVENIDRDWNEKYNTAFEALRDFIVTDLKINNSKLIRSYNSFVPIFEYLFHNPTPSPDNKSRLKAFYYKAQLFKWFSSQTDGILDYLHNNYLNNIGKANFPLESILQYFSSKRSATIVFDKKTLLDHNQRFFYLHLLYVETYSESAFNVKLKHNAPHIDHIYPQSKLKKEPIKLPMSEINHIGNYRLVGAMDNIRKNAEAPDSYFKRLKESKICDIKKHLLVKKYSNDPALLILDKKTYLKFRDERFEQIFSILEPIINFI